MPPQEIFEKYCQEIEFGGIKAPKKYYNLTILSIE